MLRTLIRISGSYVLEDGNGEIDAPVRIEHMTAYSCAVSTKRAVKRSSTLGQGPSSARRHSTKETTLGVDLVHILCHSRLSPSNKFALLGERAPDLVHAR